MKASTNSNGSITRTFSTKRVTLTAKGKNLLTVDTTDAMGAANMYALMNGIPVTDVTATTEVVDVTRRMSIDDFIKYSEIIEPKANEVKTDGGNK